MKKIVGSNDTIPGIIANVTNATDDKRLNSERPTAWTLCREFECAVELFQIESSEISVRKKQQSHHVKS